MYLTCRAKNPRNYFSMKFSSMYLSINLQHFDLIFFRGIEYYLFLENNYLIKKGKTDILNSNIFLSLRILSQILNSFSYLCLKKKKSKDFVYLLVLIH